MVWYAHFALAVNMQRLLSALSECCSCTEERGRCCNQRLILPFYHSLRSNHLQLAAGPPAATLLHSYSQFQLHMLISHQRLEAFQDKYVHFITWRNTICNSDKCIFQFGRTHFAISCRGHYCCSIVAFFPFWTI